MANLTLKQQPDSNNLIIYPTSDILTNFSSSTDTGSYTEIDDLWNNYDSTDYVYSLDSEASDRYGMTNHTTETGTINYVKIYTRAWGRYVGSSPSFYSIVSMNTHSTPSISSWHTVSNSLTRFMDTYLTAPDGGTWTWTDVDNMEVGFHSDISDYGLAYATTSNTPDAFSPIMHCDNKYIFMKDSTADEIDVYSYSYPIDTNTLSMSKVSVTTMNPTATNLKDFNIYHDGTDTLLVSASGDYMFFYELDYATEDLVEHDYDNYIGLDYSHYMGCKGVFIDDAHLYAIWSDITGGEAECSISIYVHNKGAGTTVIAEEKTIWSDGSASTKPDNCYITVRNAGGSTRYVFYTYWDEGSNDTRVAARHYDTITHIMTAQIDDEVFSLDDPDDVVYDIIDDGTNVYWLWRDDSTDDLTISTCSYDGVSFGTRYNVDASGAMPYEPDEYEGHELFMDDNGYIYVTVGRSIKVYTYTEGAFTLETTLTQPCGDTYLTGICGIDTGRNIFFSSTSNIYKCNLAQPNQIRVVQQYAVINYSPVVSTVTLPLPSDIGMNHSRNITRFTFPNGEYEVEDMSRAGKSLTLNGWSSTDMEDKAQGIADMAHYSSSVSVTGLPDSNLNTDYYIRNYNFNQRGGETILYTWSLDLEEA